MSAPLERPETLMVVMCLLEPRLRLDDQVGGAERDEAPCGSTPNSSLFITTRGSLARRGPFLLLLFFSHRGIFQHAGKQFVQMH